MLLYMIKKGENNEVKLKDYKLPKKDIFILTLNDNGKLSVDEYFFKYEIPKYFLNSEVEDINEEEDFVEVWIR